MTLSELRNIRAMCDGFSSCDWHEVVRAIHNDESDFTSGSVRFISDDTILETLADELGSDDCLLGCFNSDFLALILDIDSDVIEALQKAEAYEAVGKLVKSLGKLKEVAEEYARADGYGHHFNGYDFGEKELTVNGKIYHVFDNH